MIILAPLFALAWLRLGRHQPSSPAKFAFGLFFLGLSFLLMVPAAMGLLFARKAVHAALCMATVMVSLGLLLSVDLHRHVVIPRYPVEP